MKQVVKKAPQQVVNQQIKQPGNQVNALHGNQVQVVTTSNQVQVTNNNVQVGPTSSIPVLQTTNRQPIVAVTSQQVQQQLIDQNNEDLLRKAKVEASKELEAARIKMQKERKLIEQSRRVKIRGGSPERISRRKRSPEPYVPQFKTGTKSKPKIHINPNFRKKTPQQVPIMTSLPPAILTSQSLFQPQHLFAFQQQQPLQVIPDFSKPPPGFPQVVQQVQPQLAAQTQAQAQKVVLNPTATEFKPAKNDVTKQNGSADVAKKSDVTSIKRTVKVERKVEPARKVLRNKVTVKNEATKNNKKSTNSAAASVKTVKASPSKPAVKTNKQENKSVKSRLKPPPSSHNNQVKSADRSPSYDVDEEYRRKVEEQQERRKKFLEEKSRKRLMWDNNAASAKSARLTDPNSMKTVIVGNLSSQTSSDQVKKLLKSVGQLQSFQMNKNVAVGVFESKKQAEKCVKKYNRLMVDLSIISVKIEGE